MYNFKTLVCTDTFHKEGAPHLIATAIECDSVNDREEKYNDVIGFYREILDVYDIDEDVIKEMDDWADILKKDIIFLLKNDKKLNGWLFEYNEDISYRKVEAFTTNDVNYDIWLDPDFSFWNPVDFLLEADYFTPDSDIIEKRIDNIEQTMVKINEQIIDLTVTIRKLIENL